MKLPDGISPRLLTPEQAALYCGLPSPEALDRHIRPLAPPRRFGRELRYDLRTLDRALDALFGLAAAPAGGPQVGDPFLARLRDRPRIGDTGRLHNGKAAPQAAGR